MKVLGPRKPIFRGGRPFFWGRKCISTYAHRCLVKIASWFLSPRPNGIDKITGRFMSKVDFWKTSKISVNLSLRQRWRKRPARERRKTCIKWTYFGHRPLLVKIEHSFDFGYLMKLIVSQGDLRQKLTVGSRREKSAFIQRTRNEATEESMKECKTCRF